MEDREQTPLQKSGKQVGEENVKKLQVYIDNLKSAGARLPSHKGKPDKSAIAVAAGFGRLTLYNNPEAVALLERAVGEVGLECVTQPSSARSTHLQQQVDRRDRRIQRLEELLATKSAENESLRRDKRVLEEKLRQYSLIEETLASSGRLFRP